MSRRAAARFAGALALLLLGHGPALAQRLGQGTGGEVPVWRVLGALGFCLALAIGAAFVLKRRLGGGRPLGFGRARARRLELVESLRLSHQVDLCIVGCDGRELLIAATPHGAVLVKDALSELPELPEPSE